MDDLPPGTKDVTTLADEAARTKQARGNGRAPAKANRTDNEPAPPTRFKLTAFNKIQLSTDNNYLVKDFVPREGLVVIWGPPKSGKSFIGYDIVMHVARGLNYRGRRVTQGAVVYVACEGERGLAARTKAYREFHAILDDEAIPFYLVTTRLNLVGERGALIAAIKQQLPGVSPAAIVIDTLNRSIPGSESDDEDMGNYVKAADTVREAFGCAVIVIHHCGIDDKRPRGHTCLTGAADCQIAIKRNVDRSITATLEFMKDGAEGDHVNSRLEVVEVGTDDDGDPITSCVVVEAEDSLGQGAPKITGQAQIALKLLLSAIDEGGEQAPENKRIPRTKKVVRQSLWEKHLKAGLVSESDKPDTTRKAMKRAAEKLQAADIIGVWDGWVWVTDNSDKAGQART